MVKKKTLEEVSAEFTNRGYGLLETEYINSKTKMKFICPKHPDKETKITYSHLVKGVGCKFCGYDKVALDVGNRKRRYSIEHVNKALKENGCQLLDENMVYHNDKELFRYKCKCGNICKTNFGEYKRGLGVCRICVQKIKKPTKLKYEYDFVKKFFEDRNCKLLSKSYVDAHEKLDYLCECGNKSKIAWHHFRQGSRCLNCAENKRRHTYEDVKNYIEEKGCKLLSKEYQNSTSQKLDIICCCGNTHSIRFSAFKQGARCPRCSVTSRGEKKIAQFLEVNGIKYKYQYVIKKCRNINPLPFDFAVLGNSGAIKCLIEFDGKQHFAPIDFFGGEESYHKVRNNDYIKNTYCQTNNLLLFRISYKDLENVDHILKEILVKNNCKFISKYQVNKPRLNEIGNRSIIESSYGNSYEINENTEGGTAS